MKFTKYIWEVYAESKQGEKSIKLFKNCDIKELSETYKFEYIFNDNEFNAYESMLKWMSNISIKSNDDIELVYKDFVEWEKDNKGFPYFFFCLQAYSTGLFKMYPDYFLPFYFETDNYTNFLKVIENFDLHLPEPPARNNKLQRIRCYFEICKVLHNFRRKIGLDVYSFLACIYDFGINCLEVEEKEELPKPSKVFYLGADGKNDFEFIENAKHNKDVGTWGAGSLLIKKGDIILMYCTSPHSCFHSIWRALEDSFVNPFSYYYFNVKVGYPQRIPKIGLKEIKSNSIFSKNPTVKGNMQGLNGRPINQEEYNELFSILHKKGFDTSKLPQLPTYTRNIEGVDYESDVESILIEPLLQNLGFSKNDWVRQLPLKMGRITKYYPDYAINVKGNKGKERAQYIVEAKYSINTDKQLEDAFLQARSYALRLQASRIIIADKEYVWLFKKLKFDFDITETVRMHWNDLESPDALYFLKKELTA